MSDSDKIDALTRQIDLEQDSKTRADLFFRRGRLKWKLGDKAAAMTDYASASSLDPDSPASEALAQAQAIMSFFHRDLYNP